MKQKYFYLLFLCLGLAIGDELLGVGTVYVPSKSNDTYFLLELVPGFGVPVLHSPGSFLETSSCRKALVNRPTSTTAFMKNDAYEKTECLYTFSV